MTHLKSAKKNQNDLLIYFFQNIAVFILNYLCVFFFAIRLPLQPFTQMTSQFV